MNIILRSSEEENESIKYICGQPMEKRAKRRAGPLLCQCTRFTFYGYLAIPEDLPVDPRFRDISIKAWKFACKLSSTLETTSPQF
jgi:hypothetical protein